jgi:hypothetical protein
MTPDETPASGGPVEAGRWLPLSQAVQSLGMSERAIYRLVSEGKLISRENGDHDIEVWVVDVSRVAGTIDPSIEVIQRDQSLLSVERLSSAMSHQVAALTAPLAASYERNVQLARENGILSERVTALERELQRLRESTAAERQALEPTRKRLEAVEGANAALTRMLAAAQQEQSDDRRSPWLVPAIVILAIVLVVAGVAVLQWLAPGLLR